MMYVFAFIFGIIAAEVYSRGWIKVAYDWALAKWRAKP